MPDNAHVSTALNALRHIEDTGSLTQAAQLLGISQPAVSKAIAAEERNLGVTLLRRGTRPLRLTVEGEILARYADRSAAMLREVLDDIDARRRHQSGLIRMGSFGASASTRVLPAMLQDFRKLHPQIGVTIMEAPNVDIMAALRADLVDFAVMIEAQGEEFENIAMPSDRLVALVPTASAYAREQAIDAALFQEQPFIMSKGGSEPLIRDWFARSNILEPRVDHAVLQITSILALVGAGLGLSIMAEMALPPLPGNVKVLPLAPEMPRQITVARHHGAMRSAAAEAFWDFAERRYSFA